MHLGVRLDRAIGRSTAFFGNALGKRRDLTSDDFSPYDRAERDRASMDPDVVFGKLMGIARGGR